MAVAAPGFSVLTTMAPLQGSGHRNQFAGLFAQHRLWRNAGLPTTPTPIRRIMKAPARHSQQSTHSTDFGTVLVDLADGGSTWFDLEEAITASQITPAPEPGSVVLLGAGLAGLAFFARKRRLAR